LYYFCTYFDHRYLSRGLALYYSLKKHCSSFKLFILCLSQECYEILKQRKELENVLLLQLNEIENGDEELLKAKQNRSLIEYYFTITPSFILYILNNFNEVDFLTYLDADLYFFSDPEPIFEEIGNSSIVITPHRFPPRLKHFEKYGVYNVSWLSFRKDENGLKCLRWYRERCNEWCYDRVEDDKFADQKYLEKFELLFEKVHVIQHKGANVAPWNIENYKLTIMDSKIYVDNQPLVFYHFHGLRKFTSFLYDSGFAAYGSKFTRIIRNNIYLPYVRELKRIEENLNFRSKEPLGRSILSKYFPSILANFPRLIRALYSNSYFFTHEYF
jgi:hypothetical protein